MKKLGIVVPIFNAELYLTQCIDSILGQTYTDFEVALIDDGSTDHSGEICDEFANKDSRVHVIHQENSGKLLARYRGAEILDCEYLTFVDSDDWIDPDTYKKMVQYFEKGIDVISFQIIRYFNETYQYVSACSYKEGLYERKNIRESIFPTMMCDATRSGCGLDPSLANKIIKKELLMGALRAAKHLDISYGDDVAVIYPLMLHAQALMITKENLYYHRQRQGNDIAPYFSDCNFYRKLSTLYEYLKQAMGQEYGFIRQLDYFYEISVKTYLKKYGDKTERVSYLFPFDKISKGKKIVLYGASKVGQTYYNQIRRLCYAEVVMWVDRSYDFYADLGVMGVESIQELKDYDYIVIAISASHVAEEIKHDLVGMGVEKEKIVWSI